jgi:hypothetical protein
MALRKITCVFAFASLTLVLLIACDTVWVEKRELRIARVNDFPECAEVGLKKPILVGQLSKVAASYQPRMVIFELKATKDASVYNGLVNKYSDGSFVLDFSGKGMRPTGDALETVRVALSEISRNIEATCSN